MLISLSHTAFCQELSVMLAPEPLEIIRSDSSYVLRNIDKSISFSKLDTAFFEKEMKVYLVKQNQKWGAVSEYGTQTLACSYDTITHLSYSFARVYINNKCGVAYTNNRNYIVVPIEYDSIYEEQSTNAFVVEKNGLLGLYYKKGKKLLDCKYSSIKPIVSDVLELKENDRVTYYINGSIINDSLDFSQTFLITNSSTQSIKPYFVNITVFGKGVINKNGVQIIPAKYHQIVYKEKIQISPKETRLNSLYIFVEERNVWGAYNVQTHETTPCSYASIEKLAVALNLSKEK